MKNGRVFFVGAGPGDSKLITLKGMEAIQKADVILYDRLANIQLLQYAKSDAEYIYCGKQVERHTMPQENINEMIVHKAKEGKCVVRLKGGDPSVFGRVAEEAEKCVEEGISFDIIPGITSGIAAATYAGITLTHRDMTSTVAFLTGHKSCDKGLEIDWENLVFIDTLVIYMGVKNLAVIQEQFLLHGKSPDTPVAVVKWGTYRPLFYRRRRNIVSCRSYGSRSSLFDSQSFRPLGER